MYKNYLNLHFVYNYKNILFLITMMKNVLDSAIFYLICHLETRNLYSVF